MAKIRTAFEHVVPANQRKEPLQITAVVVRKRHHTRLMPLPDSVHQTRNGNCLPGTVAESGITSPYYLDWFQQSYNALQGTARLARYSVLGSGILDTNGKSFTSKDLQEVMHALCYTHIGAIMSASYAPPAYYADLLAERGRCYIKRFLDGTPELRG